MPFVPKAFCATCNVPMQMTKSGVWLDAHSAGLQGNSYYKIQADQHSCPNCGNSIYAGFGQPIEHYMPEHAKVPATVVVNL